MASGQCSSVESPACPCLPSRGTCRFFAIASYVLKIQFLFILGHFILEMGTRYNPVEICGARCLTAQIHIWVKVAFWCHERDCGHVTLCVAGSWTRKRSSGRRTSRSGTSPDCAYSSSRTCCPRTRASTPSRPSTTPARASPPPTSPCCVSTQCCASAVVVKAGSHLYSILLHPPCWGKIHCDSFIKSNLS